MSRMAEYAQEQYDAEDEHSNLSGNDIFECQQWEERMNESKENENV